MEEIWKLEDRLRASIEQQQPETAEKLQEQIDARCASLSVGDLEIRDLEARLSTAFATKQWAAASRLRKDITQKCVKSGYVVNAPGAASGEIDPRCAAITDKMVKEANIKLRSEMPGKILLTSAPVKDLAGNLIFYSLRDTPPAHQREACLGCGGWGDRNSGFSPNRPHRGRACKCDYFVCKSDCRQRAEEQK